MSHQTDRELQSVLRRLAKLDSSRIPGRRGNAPTPEEFELQQELEEIFDILQNATSLGKTARDFVDEQHERFKIYGGAIILTDRQLTWLRDLAKIDER